MLCRRGDTGGMNNLLRTYVDYTRISLKLIFVHRANANVPSYYFLFCPGLLCAACGPRAER